MQPKPKKEEQKKARPAQVIGFLLELSQNHLEHFSDFVSKVLQMIKDNKSKVDKSFLLLVFRIQHLFTYYLMSKEEVLTYL